MNEIFFLLHVIDGFMNISMNELNYKILGKTMRHINYYFYNVLFFFNLFFNLFIGKLEIVLWSCVLIHTGRQLL